MRRRTAVHAVLVAAGLLVLLATYSPPPLRSPPVLLLGGDADAGAQGSRSAQSTPRERRKLGVVAGRRLGQRVPVKPPSPDPNGWKTMVKPVPPPPPPPSSIY
ncbi:hypothetical protein VPH35_106669 [Triticum aestivum]|uniref:uncharacterized protein n=1 Tax=Triticum aestivum TaxID=4565 RepID=UPI001D01B685|nr:uncharacterized protein LOC123131201 [Triticum aestivum]